MKPKFEVVFLEQAIDFMSKLEPKAKKKIYYNLDKARLENNPQLFKKLTDDIWEFRTLYKGIQYRFFAFWDKTDKIETLVLSTHGMVKRNKKEVMATKNKKIKMMTLDQMKDKDIGKVGTQERDKYEFDLKMDVLGDMIKSVRKERKLTQEQLGELIGVQKSQISKLERNTKNVTIETILKVFRALKANVKFSIEMNEFDFKVA